MAGLFALPHSIINGSPQDFVSEISNDGFTSLNLCLKYHASRNLFVRHGMSMMHLEDGAHYYETNSHFYSEKEIAPETNYEYISQKKIESLVSAAMQSNVALGSWSVFLHDSKLAASRPDCVSINVFDQKLNPNLCPANPSVRAYVIGHVREMLNMGFSHIALESINFAPFKHNEHHERFFFNSSPITEYLLSLCFCTHCKSLMETRNIDVPKAREVISRLISTSLETDDPLLHLELTQENLVGLMGDVFLKIQGMREQVVSDFHNEMSIILKKNSVTSRFLDSTPLTNRKSTTPYDDLWIQGASLENLASSFTAIEPLLYRWTTQENVQLAQNYQKLEIPSVLAIRPVYPDVNTFDELEERLTSMFALQMPLDFYLYDIIRPREMKLVKTFLQ
jgi:hypothetical protein